METTVYNIMFFVFMTSSYFDVDYVRSRNTSMTRLTLCAMEHRSFVFSRNVCVDELCMSRAFKIPFKSFENVLVTF